MALENKPKPATPREETRNPNPRPAPVARREVNTFDESSDVPARILWPALGFPQVICPTGHGPLVNPTNCVQLLIATSTRSLTARDVARHLRYVSWKNRRERYSEARVGANAFAENDIELLEVKPDRSDALAEQVRFGGGWVVANLAKRVRALLTKHGLPYLFAISISETGSAALPAGSLFNLYWISENKNATPLDMSHEMQMLIDGHAKVVGGNDIAPARVVPLGDPRNAFHYMLGEYAFEYGQPPLAENYVEVLHPLFVRAPRATIQLAHLTDVHCDTRHEVYARNLKSDPAIKKFNNWNETFLDLYQQAQRSDAILLTGDLIEYGRGHLEKHFSLGQNDGYWRDRNWFLFYRQIASGDTRYAAPVYTTLGNHDWRVNPYGPTAPGAPSPSDFNLSSQDQIKTAWGADYGAVGPTVLGQDKAEYKAIETTVDSVAWYLLLINPFLDYIVQYPAPVDAIVAAPQRYSFLMLDWANTEETMKVGLFSQYEKLVDESASAGGLIISRGAPWARNALTDLQKELTWWFLTQERTAKVVGAHWGIVSPRPSWPQDSMLEGLIDPCPICNGAGFKDEAVTARATERVECPCRKAFPQTPGRRTRHPIVAFGNPSSLSEDDLFRVQPRWGSFVNNRRWFIDALVKSDVSVVLCGHNHRNSAFFIRQRDGSGDGRRLHEAFLGGAKIGESAGVAIGIPDHRLTTFKLDGLADKDENRPVFVNTVCGGPHATDRQSAGTVIPGAPANVNKGKRRGKVHVDPGFRTIEVRPDGAIVSIKNVFSTRHPASETDTVDVVK